MSVTPSDPVARAPHGPIPSRMPAAARRGDPGRSAAGRAPAMRATRAAASRRRRLAALVAAAATIVAVMMGAALPGPAAYAADPTPSPSPSPSASPALSGTVEPFLAPMAHGVLGAGLPLTAWVSLRNGTEYSLAASEVTLRVGTATLGDAAGLTAWLSGTASAGALTTLGTASLDPAQSGATVTTLVTIPAANPILHALTPGVHALEATIRGVAATHVATSTIVVPDPHLAARTPVGLIVPITAGPLSTGLLTADQLATLTAPGGDLNAQLNAVAGTSAILAIDPAIPAAIRVLGSSAPAGAVAWLERLNLLPNDRFALQFGDADVAVQTRSGLASLLHPATLQPFMDPADFRPKPDTTPTASPEPAPTATTGPGTPPFPGLAALEDIGPNARPAVTWPFSGTADAKVLAALGRTVADAATPVSLIPSDTTVAGADGTAVPARGAVGSSQVLVYDSGVSSALRAATATDDPHLRGQPLAAASAYLTLAARALGSHPLLVVVDRTADHTGLSDAVDLIGRASETIPTTLATLVSSAAPPVTMADAAPSVTRATAFAGLAHGEQELAAFSSVLADPTLITAPERAEVLQLLGGGWLDDPTAWQAALTAHTQATAKTLGSVSIAPTSTFNLLGTSGPLGFGIRNDLPWPVHVSLLTAPDDLRIEVQTATAVVAQASSTTRVAVPVRARIGNGDVTLELRLISRTGVAIGQPQSVQLNVRADWEVIGLTVLGGAIGAFLALGLVRTILARRRRRTPDAAEPAAPDHPDGSEP